MWPGSEALMRHLATASVGVLRSACSVPGSPAYRPNVSLEARQILRDGPLRCAFHCSVVTDHFGAELSERRGAASATTECGVHDRLPKHGIHAVNEQPGGSIRHVHPARGFTDRAAIADRFQNLDFPGPKRTIGRQVEPKEDACHIPMVRPASRRGSVVQLSPVARVRWSRQSWPRSISRRSGSGRATYHARVFDRPAFANFFTLAPGITASKVGPRNEDAIYLRGFDQSTSRMAREHTCRVGLRGGPRVEDQQGPRGVSEVSGLDARSSKTVLHGVRQCRSPDPAAVDDPFIRMAVSYRWRKR
jgi:hypothetical protein